MSGNLTAAQVLHQHVLLTERMRRPDPLVADFLRYHMDDVIKDNGGRATAMFHPVIPAGTRRRVKIEEAQALAQLIGSCLAAATTFQVAGNMVRDMRSIFEATWEGPEIIHSREVPCTSGFAWLDEPWMIGPPRTGFTVRALSWQFTEVYTVNDLADPPIAPQDYPWPCVRVCMWRYGNDETDPREHFSSDLGSLLITHTAIIPLDMLMEKAAYDDEEEGGAPSTESFLALVHLLWMFLGMEITSTSRAQVKAGYLKRAGKVLHHPEVKIVLLRKLRHAGEETGEHRPVDWSCRWIVQGHYRHKERPEHPHSAVATGSDKHCAVCGGQLSSWVAPYIKGPDGFPLRATEQVVMRLAR
jgi:hypothetical protein